MWKRIGSILRFAYANDNTLGLDSTCFATGSDIEFICCVLNSPMGHYLLKDAPKTGTGDLLVSVQAVDPILIPKVPSSINEQCKTALNSLCSKDNPEKEAELNDMIFEIYGLSPTERAYIEDNF